MCPRSVTTMSSTLEEENRGRISELKDAIAALNLTVAVNTEVTKGLKDIMEKEFGRHVEERRGLENRFVVVEAKVDTIELKMAADTNMRERLRRVEDTTSKLDRSMTGTIGWSKGAMWAAGIFGLISLPCIGFVASAIIKKLWDL